MAFLSAMNISASGMSAQRMRLDVAAENLANVSTTRTQNGEPYRRKVVVFEERPQSGFMRVLKKRAGIGSDAIGAGVQVGALVEDERDFKLVYDPAHPDANEDGYVLMPNVDPLKETVDSMAATRSYEANITAFNALKTMAQKGLEIGR